MHISAAPLIVPAQDEKVFDKYWAYSINIYGDYPSSRLDIVLKRFRTVSPTEIEYANEQPKILTISNLLELAAVDPEIQEIMGKLYSKIESLIDEGTYSE